MSFWKKCCVLVLVAAGAGLALRVPALQKRPMHGDEAVHAIKFGDLLEKNKYIYDKNEYHGPSLNYFTLIPAWITGQKNITQVTETTLRVVPVFFGIALVVMPLLLLRGLNKWTVILISALTAVSPAMVYYSRYYIQEILLVCFTFGMICCLWRYIVSRRFVWAAAGGSFAGLMHATKETCVIAFGSMALAAVITVMIRRRQKSFDASGLRIFKIGHIAGAAVCALAVSACFYSSFFTNPKGIIDSFATYTTYFDRAANNPLHIHPWYYYLDILTYMEFAEKLTWNEDIIVVGGLVGFLVIVLKGRKLPFDYSLVLFLAIYTLLMTGVYSLIPYKTPWSMLSFLHGMILLAGIGMFYLFSTATHRLEKIIIYAVFIIAFLTLPLQAWLQDFYYYASPSNPYVYAHATNDVFKIAARMEQAAAIHPEGHNMYVQVICPKNDYWPLPWYLRSFKQVGYWNDVDDNVPSAEVILAMPAVEEKLLHKLYEVAPVGQRPSYVPLFEEPYLQLRPTIEIRGYMTLALRNLLRINEKSKVP